jgi:hypothetical protein
MRMWCAMSEKGWYCGPRFVKMEFSSPVYRMLLMKVWKRGVLRI